MLALGGNAAMLSARVAFGATRALTAQPVRLLAGLSGQWLLGFASAMPLQRAGSPPRSRDEPGAAPGCACGSRRALHPRSLTLLPLIYAGAPAARRSLLVHC